MNLDNLEFTCNHMDESPKHITVLKKQHAKKCIYKFDSNYMTQKQAKLT